MYSEHPTFIQPEDEDVKIWRYIDFTKLVSMLSSQSLYFTRSDKFDDPFEGSYPRIDVFLRYLTPKEWPEEKRDVYFKQMHEFSRIAKENRKYAAINCWHMNDHESAAMWKLYLKSKEGVAIQSTYSKLKKCFVNKENIYVGLVKYIDYKSAYISDVKDLFMFLKGPKRIRDMGNLFTLLMHKRISFSHEREVRAVVSRFPDPQSGSDGGVIDLSVETIKHGMPIRVNLDVLVERIYVAPDAPEWLKELVKSVVSQYGHKFEVIDSKLSDQPIF